LCFVGVDARSNHIMKKSGRGVLGRVGRYEWGVYGKWRGEVEAERARVEEWERWAVGRWREEYWGWRRAKEMGDWKLRQAEWLREVARAARRRVVIAGGGLRGTSRDGATPTAYTRRWALGQRRGDRRESAPALSRWVCVVGPGRLRAATGR